MKINLEGMQKIRQALDSGAASLDSSIATRLAKVRYNALDHQKKVAATSLSLAGIGSGMGNILLPRFPRMLVAIAALTLGIAGTYYLNAFDQADENADVDSALLADDLPIDAYTDHGFQTWLEHSSQSSPQ
ncbi:conserved protein of unknown function [Georgfuchsia toluolica]|uniref:DUF3619 family protein n=1 Tax=Georgfuchsia toluolica TaxID=424218 RepID=A0A916JAF5_9PROT|nr:DUF3619 family protein [Georgfuchsia toluolica]CAG4885308.1 conserved protein of unknown function [Georgfuchsia toluolica]